RGRIGPSWYVDETFIKVKGRSVYLYRAIDRDGHLVDVLLSEKRDKAAAEAFFRSARTVTGRVPERVTSDGHDAYPGAIKATLGEAVRHRTNRYLVVPEKVSISPKMQEICRKIRFSFRQILRLWANFLAISHSLVPSFHYQAQLPRLPNAAKKIIHFLLLANF